MTADPIPELLIVGFTIHEVASSSQLTVRLTGPANRDSAELRIGGAFVFQQPPDDARHLVGDADGGARSSLGMCLNFYGSEVSAARINNDGALFLECHGGPLLNRRLWTLQVPPDEKYEDWEVETEGPNKIHIIAMPGGELAVFR